MIKNNETVLVTAFTPSVDKLDNLRELVKNLKQYGYKVCLSTHSKTPQDIIDRCDYFIYDKENEVNYDIDIRHWRFYTTPNFSIRYKPINYMSTHIVPIVRLIMGGLSYLKSIGAKKVYLLEYDTVVETNDVFKMLSSSLDECTISGFFDEWGGDDSTKNHRKGKYFFGPLMGLNIDRVDVSTFPTDSETLISIFREYFNRNENLPCTERIFFDLLWSKYDIKWNEFETVQNGLILNTSANQTTNNFERTYCFFLRDGRLDFFAGNDTDSIYTVDLIINQTCIRISVPNSSWTIHPLALLEDIKIIKVLINNTFIEEIDMTVEHNIDRFTKWVVFEEKKSD